MYRKFALSLKDAWSATCFANDEVAYFARKLTVVEARQGLMGMSLILMCLSVVEGFLFSFSGLGNSSLYTCLLLGGLALHILVSARAVQDARTLYLLGTTLLMISGTAFVLLAHTSGTFNYALFASITLLFMVIPIVPWGLKEALLVLCLIYLTFTVSIWSSSQSFDAQALWSLQVIMLGAGTISLAMVMRNTCIRKANIHTRFELEQANREMMQLSNKDPLTGAWNRRFLQNVFPEKTAAWHAAGQTYHFAYLDLDNFKPINDNCGHDYGDEVLRCVSRVLARKLAGEGYIIRMGGDEFALLFVGDDPGALITTGLASVQSVSKPPAHCSYCKLGMSAGIVSIPPGVELTQAEICQAADAALYEAKRSKQAFDGKAHVVLRVLEQTDNRQKTVA